MHKIVIINLLQINIQLELENFHIQLERLIGWFYFHCSFYLFFTLFYILFILF